MRIDRVVVFAQAAVACMLSCGCMQASAVGARDLGMTGEEFAALKRLVVPVYTVEDDPSRGRAASAIVLADDLLLTCAHVIPERFGPDGGEVPPHASSPIACNVNRRPAWFQVVAAGDRQTRDWAVLRVLAADGPSPVVRAQPEPLTVELDPDRVIETGQRILLVGYMQADHLSQSGPTVLSARAARARNERETPPGLVDAAALLGVDPRGMSGGALAVWEPQRRALVVVGILALGVKAVSGPLRLPAGFATCACRVPQEVVDQVPRWSARPESIQLPLAAPQEPHSR